PPQSLAVMALSVKWSLKVVSGLWQTHWPFSHTDSAPHTLPHLPQFSLSVAVSVQPPGQLWSGAQEAPPVPVELTVLTLLDPPAPLVETNAPPRQPAAGTATSAAASQPNQKPSFIGISSTSPPAPRGET